MITETGLSPPFSQNPRLDISALARVFNTYTNSYKFLFFQALLAHLKEKDFPDSEVEIRLRDLAIEMAVLAWYPSSYFRLTFGSQDQICKLLRDVAHNKENSISNGKLNKQLREEIGGRYEKLELDRILLRYVQYAFLKPFFEEETLRAEGARYERIVKDLSSHENRLSIPLYRFRGGDSSTIYVPREWMQYLSTHYSIVEGWAKYEWAKFLQRRNPNVPAIIEKLEPPKTRGPLGMQTKFWDQIIQRKTIMCIYSQQPLIAGEFELDHFIPWSFVAHDELWNLVPVKKDANRSKGNKLPADQYLMPMIQLHFLALTESKIFMGERNWHSIVESHLLALKLDYTSLLYKHRLTPAYKAILTPLMAIAKQIGFSDNWKFK